MQKCETGNARLTGLENGNGQLNENGLPVLNPFTSRSFPVFLERDPVERTVYGKFFLTRTVHVHVCVCMCVCILCIE